MRWGTKIVGTLVVLAACIVPLRAAENAAPTASSAAPSIATDAERSYAELRKSKDRATLLLAERWHGLVQLQEWSDASGKFSTTAKFVEHAADLSSVKLRVIQGTGDKRIVKDLTIPMEKLSKVCQSRVKQIAFLESKIGEAAAAEKEKATTEKSADGMATAGEMPREGRPGRERPERGGMDERDMRGEDARTRPTRGRPGTDPPDSDPSMGRDPRPAMSAPAGGAVEAVSSPGGDRLGAVLPPLPSGASMQGAGLADAAAPSPGGAAPPAAANPQAALAQSIGADLKENAAWRTSYDAFRANFSAQRDPDTDAWQINWGELAKLQAAWSKSQERVLLERGGRQTSITEEGIKSQLAEIGEFVWAAQWNQPPGQEENWSAALGLAPLPEPLKLVIKPDQEHGTGDWQQFQPGEPVRFIGRFVGFEGEFGIVIAIRFPAGGGPAPDESYGRSRYVPR